jgi:hypothetical protein
MSNARVAELGEDVGTTVDEALTGLGASDRADLVRVARVRGTDGHLRMAMSVGHWMLDRRLTKVMSGQYMARPVCADSSAVHGKDRMKEPHEFVGHDGLEAVSARR